MQMLQQPDMIIIIYDHDHQVRHVRLNAPHPAQVTPSWYGDSVGRYEGDTLVIDTVGIKIGPFSMIDWYGTPYTRALHVVERYRLINNEAAKEAEDRGSKVVGRVEGGDGLVPDPDYRDRALQLQFTVEDEGVFTMPWSATITRRRSSNRMAGICLCRKSAWIFSRKARGRADRGQAGLLSGRKAGMDSLQPVAGQGSGKARAVRWRDRTRQCRPRHCP